MCLFYLSKYTCVGLNFKVLYCNNRAYSCALNNSQQFKELLVYNYILKWHHEMLKHVYLKKLVVFIKCAILIVLLLSYGNSRYVVNMTPRIKILIMKSIAKCKNLHALEIELLVVIRETQISNRRKV